jgi:hypothetical protein
MNGKDVSPGLYRVYWDEGGYSLAAVGVLSNGDRWLAPINWVHPTENQDYWRQVTALVPVELPSGHKHSNVDFYAAGVETGLVLGRIAADPIAMPTLDEVDASVDAMFEPLKAQLKAQARKLLKTKEGS